MALDGTTLEHQLCTAELVGYKAASELSNIWAVEQILKRAGYKPGSPQWSNAMHGAHVAWTNLRCQSIRTHDQGENQ